MNILLSGYTGRMGNAIAQVVSDSTHASNVRASSDAIVACVHRPEDYAQIDIHQQNDSIDIAIDFSTPAGTDHLLTWAEHTHVPLVIGTTALPPETVEHMHRVSKITKIVYASNFSIGVNVLLSLVKSAVLSLPIDFQVDVVESHHKHKKDSPSGTAKTIAKEIKSAQDMDARRHGCVDYLDEQGENASTSGVRIHSLRMGDVIGTHEVIFSGDGEILRISHTATDRLLFARGAIHAARWLLSTSSTSGMYSMQDVLYM